MATEIKSKCIKAACGVVIGAVVIIFMCMSVATNKLTVMPVTVIDEGWYAGRATNREYTGWNYYRIGDMILNKKFRTGTNGIDYYRNNFPGSLALEYLETTDDNMNFTVLMNIIKKRTNSSLIPNDNTLVVHLRTGDVIDQWKNSVSEFLTSYVTRKGYLHYTQPISYFANILRNISRSNYNVTDVAVVTGFLKPIPHPKSRRYIDEIIRFFANNDILKFNNISLRLNKNPDEDFIFMCNSKYFVKSGGGFSWIISHVVTRKHGMVFV